MAITFASMARASGEELEAIFAAGVLPDMESLAGWEFRGHNPPRWAEVVGIYKFKKGFYRKTRGRWDYEGYNIGVKNSPITEPWECKPSNARPRRFGFYSVRRPGEIPARVDRRYENAVLLDYSEPRQNFRLDPSRLLKDYVVQVDAGNADLYLGKAFLRAGPGRIFSNFFLLERDCKADYHPE